MNAGRAGGRRRSPGARWVARRLLEPRDADRLLDALDDELVEFQERERGRRRARLWYWRQVLRSVPILRTRRRAERAGRRLSGSPADALRELRLIVRSLSRTPGFTAATIATLALGLGTVTALFSVVDQVVRRPLPYPDSDRILRAWTRTNDGDVEDFSFRVVEYEELGRRTDRFDAVAGEFPIDLPVNLPGQHPFQTHGRMITPDFFEVFGTRPARGRMFRTEEIAGGSALVTVVTHRFWTRYLGASPDALGRAIDLGGRPYTVIGVLPAGYWHVSGPDVDVFVPYTIGTSGWIGRWLDLYLRIPATATPAEVEAEVSAVVAGIGRTDARSDGWHATVATVHEMVIGDVRLTVWTTFAASALLLAIACANVVNLMLARGTVRRRELALRVALGADRARLIRHVLVESTILAAGGGALGFLGAWLGMRVLIALAPDVPRISSLSLDPMAGLFGAGLIGLTAIVCGLVPAVRQARTSAISAGHTSTRSHTGRFGGLLSGLVVAELAVATGLVVAAGLVIRTFHALSDEDYGFRRGTALTFRVSPPSSRWPGRDGTLAFYRELHEGLLALPGVTAVGAGSDLPLGGQGAVATVTSESRIEDGLLEGVTVLQRRAGPGYFDALGTPMLAGREFDERDGPASPLVAVVSASLARLLFPGDDAVGRRIAFGSRPADADWMTVVGVAADMRFTRPDRVDDPQIYQAHAQSPTREMALVVRTISEALRSVPAAQTVLAAVDPRVPAYDIAALDGVVGRAIAGRRLATGAFGLFGFAALALALAGVYGVVAFAAGRRRRELGVRLALGARPADLVRLVVGQGMWMVLAGVGLGLAGAIVASRALESLLYGITATDSATFAITAAIVAAAGLAGCYLPARRAARLDPLHILRRE